VNDTSRPSFNPFTAARIMDAAASSALQHRIVNKIYRDSKECVEIFGSVSLRIRANFLLLCSRFVNSYFSFRVLVWLSRLGSQALAV